MKRKGQLGTLQKIIIFSIVLIILLSFVTYMILKMQGGCHPPDEAFVCRLSVETVSMTRFGEGGITTIGSKSPFELECDRYFIQFEEDHVSCGTNPAERDRKHEFYYKGRETDEYPKLTSDIVNYVVAEELRKCWFQFLEGKVDVFNKDVFDFFKDKKTCFICSEISFKEDIEVEYEDGEHFFTGFYDYIDTNEIVEGTTYLEYLNENTLSTFSFDEIAEGYEIKLDPGFVLGKKYVVMFVKEGAGAKFDIFGSTENYYSYVFPKEEVGKFCNLPVG